MFSVLDVIVLKSLPIPDVERLVAETPSGRSKGKSRVKLRGTVEQKAMRKRLLFSLLSSYFAGRTQVPPAV